MSWKLGREGNCRELCFIADFSDEKRDGYRCYRTEARGSVFLSFKLVATDGPQAEQNKRQRCDALDPYSDRLNFGDHCTKGHSQGMVEDCCDEYADKNLTGLVFCGKGHSKKLRLVAHLC